MRAIPAAEKPQRRHGKRKNTKGSSSFSLRALSFLCFFSEKKEKGFALTPLFSTEIPPYRNRWVFTGPHRRKPLRSGRNAAKRSPSPWMDIGPSPWAKPRPGLRVHKRRCSGAGRPRETGATGYWSNSFFHGKLLKSKQETVLYPRSHRCRHLGLRTPFDISTRSMETTFSTDHKKAFFHPVPLTSNPQFCGDPSCPMPTSAMTSPNSGTGHPTA